MALEACKNCRVCGSADLSFLFSLGAQPVSNFVEKSEVADLPKVPIDLNRCNKCGLVQQRYEAPQDFLYTRHYWYRSGVTETMQISLWRLATEAAKRVNLQPDDIVLDIGSNDGTFLRSPCFDLALTVGVEPATNLAEEGRQGVDYFINEFWESKHFFHAVGNFRKAKIVTALGMFYDLPNPNQFIADIAKVLAPDGLFVAQLMCLKQTIDNNDIGNFVHEHIEFYSLQSLEVLFENHGLIILDIEENKVNGGSYRLCVGHRDSKMRNLEGLNRIEAARSAEKTLDNPAVYKQFYSRMLTNKAKLRAFIQKAVVEGKRTWVLGASTKGNLILSWCELGPDLIEGASDRSPEKAGKCTVTGIPIFSEEAARAVNPDFFLILPYAFRKELVEREKPWRDAGGKFIFAIPEMEVL